MTFEILKDLDSGIGNTLGDYKFLYGFVSLIRPKHVVEVGTNYGLSAIVMAMALRDEGLEKSKITSIEIIPQFLEVAEKQLKQMNLLKYVELVCEDSAIISSYPQFDVGFIDGDHSYEGVMADFENMKNKATYILIHDSVQCEAVAGAVEKIKSLKTHTTLNISVGNQGVQWSLGKVVYQSYPGFAVVMRNSAESV